MKILGTGLSGLVGSRIVELLSDRYEFEKISRNTGIDVTDREKIIEKIKSSDASIVLHLAAKTDVDGCERDKALGENGDAWKINVEGTKNVVDACQERNKKLIYVSTDFVFDGKNPSGGGYTEEDAPSPINWYAKTKYESEKIIQRCSTPWIIARIAYPYRGNFNKLDFARAILERLQNNEKVAGVTDHIFTPTFVDDIAYAIDKLMEKKSTGLFHVVGCQFLSPFDAAQIIARVFDCDQKLISKTTRSEFFKDRAPRSFQLAINSDKIRRLGIKMRGLEEGLMEIKKQQKNLKFKI